MATTLTDLVNIMQTCCITSGFKTFKFGKLSSINFDHNITYDLLNFQYPTSRIIEGSTNLQIYNCILTAARTTSASNATGVQALDDVHLVMSDLEKKLLTFINCVGSSDNCKNVITKDTIQLIRDKGTHNDNVVTVNCSFNIEVFANCLTSDCN